MPRHPESLLALLSATLDRDATDSLSQQLYRHIRDRILTGQISPGSRLPSSRLLATLLGVSRTTSMAACDQLIADGYLVSRPGSGLYVQALAATEHPSAAFAPFVSPSPRAAAPPAPALLPLDVAAQEATLFPARDWARLLARSWRSQATRWMADQDPAGLFSLRAAIADYLRALRGVTFDPAQILVTQGNRESLELILAMVREDKPAAAAWLENPGYPQAFRQLLASGVRPVAVPVDADGIRVEEGRRLAPDARLAIVTPSRQFPLGQAMSLPRRLALLEWAHQSGALIVEDDYDCEIRFAGRPLVSLATLTDAAPVLVLGGFSKLTYPGLRLSYIAGPPHWIDRLRAIRMRDGHPPPITAQPALAEFLASGAMGRYLRRLRQSLSGRRLALLDALDAQIPSLAVPPGQQSGMFLCGLLCSGAVGDRSDIGVDTGIAIRAAEVGVSVRPLSRYCPAPPFRQGLLLGYAGWDRETIRAAVGRLAHVMR